MTAQGGHDTDGEGRDTMTDTTTDTYGDARLHAIRAAAMDSRYLITPAARSRCLAALEGHDDELSTAARLVLLDGAAWQGLAGGEWARDLGAWSRAADMLEGYVLEAGTRDTNDTDTDTTTDTGGTP